MKGQGKSAGSYSDLGARVATTIRVHRKCIKQGCGKWYTIPHYKITPEDYLCGKHKLELHEKEADMIMFDRKIDEALLEEIIK